MPLPSWLDIRPSDYMQAIEAGDRSGQALVEQKNRADEAKFKNWMQVQQLQQQASEMTARQQQAQSAAQALQEYRMQEAATADTKQKELQDYRMSEMTARQTHADTAGTRADETARHNQAVEKGLLDYRNSRLDQIDNAQEIAADKAKKMVDRGEAQVVTFPEAPGMQFIKNPSGSVFKISGSTREPSVSLNASGIPERFSGPLNNPTIQSLMGTNAPASMQPAPAQTPTMPDEAAPANLGEYLRRPPISFGSAPGLPMADTSTPGLPSSDTSAPVKASVRKFRDSSGKSWTYTGTENSPLSDTDVTHWEED
jgi:hypothetical protein